MRRVPAGPRTVVSGRTGGHRPRTMPQKLPGTSRPSSEASGVAHFADEDTASIPHVALCGAALRGVPSHDKPLCCRCEAIRSAEWLQIVLQLSGDGSMN